METISRNEAKMRQLTHYFTGTICLRGHNALRFVSSKQCTLCARELGKDRRCKNPENSRKHCREWYRRNLDKERERNRKKGIAYYGNNSEKVCGNKRIQYLKNPNPFLERRHKQYWKNPTKSRKKAKEWKRNNSAKYLAYEHTRRARKRAIGGRFTADDIDRIRKLQGNRCARCYQSLIGKKVHRDHIIPLSRPGSSNDPKNIQLLCAPCNIAKKDRDPIDDARRCGRLL